MVVERQAHCLVEGRPAGGQRVVGVRVHAEVEGIGEPQGEVAHGAVGVAPQHLGGRRQAELPVRVLVEDAAAGQRTQDAIEGVLIDAELTREVADVARPAHQMIGDTQPYRDVKGAREHVAHRELQDLLHWMDRRRSTRKRGCRGQGNLQVGERPNTEPRHARLLRRTPVRGRTARLTVAARRRHSRRNRALAPGSIGWGKIVVCDLCVTEPQVACSSEVGRIRG